MFTVLVVFAACAPVPEEARVVLQPQAAELRAVYASDGVWVAEQSGELAPVQMSLRSWGREAALERVESVVPVRGQCGSRCTRRMDYVRRGLVEWWEERSDGFEHGFTVESPPPGDGFLVFDVVVIGAEVSVADGRATAATFTRPNAPSMSYDRVAAWDETGMTLPAWMETTPKGLRLVVDDTIARGSVTVDPLLTSAWVAESNQGGARFGRSVSSAGDVNGDGYDDVVVGAYLYDSGLVDVGGAFLFAGSPTGLGTTAAWSAASDQVGALFGDSVSSAGDVNGDGYDDVVVGASSYDNGELHEGRAFLFVGSGIGLETTAAWTAESDQFAASFGQAVSTAGDVNGDGHDDVVIGAWAYDILDNEGRAYLYLGSALGLDNTASWIGESDQEGAHFGESLSAAGDVNGDGYGDVVIGAHSYETSMSNGGSAFLYLGSVPGLETTAAWSGGSDQDGADFGESVSSAGDVNNDGFDDVVVGSPLYGGLTEGRIDLYLGLAVGLDQTAAWTVSSDQLEPHFGTSVSSAGDVNGDDYDDIVVGAPLFGAGLRSHGAAFLYLGSESVPGTEAAWTAELRQGFDTQFGGSVSSAGDVNGDGYDEVVVGAEGYDHPLTDEGRAYLYLGGIFDPDMDGVPQESDVCPHVADPGQQDVDGDGVGDACVPLTLIVTQVAVSGGLSVVVNDAVAGETVSVFLANGPPEMGPCPEGRLQLCLDVGERTQTQRWDIVADGTGQASLLAALPAAAVEGITVTVQAAASRGDGGVKSDPVETTVAP